MSEGAHPWLKGDGVLSRQPFLLVAGGYRCGSTSLFEYLAAHPQVRASRIKEPAFFFSLRLAETPPVYPPGREAEAYLRLFPRGGRVLLEGTSNYLNDPGSAARIARALPRAKVLLLLRDPITRLGSWYRFLQLQGALAADLAFDDWVSQQLEARGEDGRYAYQALAHGRYAPAVADYLQTLGPERVKWIWFDDLCRNPRATLEAVSRFAGLDPGFYREYAFPVQNESSRLRHPRLFAAYRRLHRPLLRLCRPWPMLEFDVRAWWYGRVEPALLRPLLAPAVKVRPSPSLRQRLLAYYHDDLRALEAVCGERPSWADAHVA